MFGFAKLDKHGFLCMDVLRMRYRTGMVVFAMGVVLGLGVGVWVLDFGLRGN